MARSVRNYVVERAEIFHLLRDVKWLIVISVGSALIENLGFGFVEEGQQKHGLPR
jgi:hypothetical protein